MHWPSTSRTTSSSTISAISSYWPRPLRSPARACVTVPSEPQRDTKSGVARSNIYGFRKMGAEVRDLSESIHPHPTLSETLMNAAEVFYGTATEYYKPKRKPSS